MLQYATKKLSMVGMVNGWRTLVALRLFGTVGGSRLMSFVGVLSIGGLALAVAVLLTVLSVVNGFERELKERVLAVLPQGTLYPRASFADWQASMEEIRRHASVLGVAPVVEGSGLAVSKGELTGIMFRGIDVELEPAVSILPDFVEPGGLERLAATRFGVLVGAELAERLQVEPGDTFSVVLPDVAFSLAGPLVTTKRLKVVGVFRVGADIDKTQLILNISDASKLKRQAGIDGLVIRVEDLFDVHRVLHELVLDNPELYGVSWMRQNGNLYEAIGTQKATLFLLLLILVAVAVFNVVSNLVMTVDDNRSEIAILKTMGASPRDLRIVFILHGVMVGVIGLVLGLVIGVVLTLLLPVLYGVASESMHLTLMQEYFIRYLPTEILANDVFLISIVSLSITLLATIYPATRAANANPIEALQYEV